MALLLQEPLCCCPQHLLPGSGGSAKGDHSDRTGLAVGTSAALRRIGRRVQIWDGDVGHWQELCGAQGRAAANGHPEDVRVSIGPHL